MTAATTALCPATIERYPPNGRCGAREAATRVHFERCEQRVSSFGKPAFRVAGNRTISLPVVAFRELGSF